MSTIIKLTATVICGLTLAACGGGGSDITSYTVTPSVSGGGGTISPAVSFAVPAGQAVPFVLTPGPGYTAGPVGGTCGGTLDGNTYTSAAITADCTVVATFTASSPAHTFSYEMQAAPDPTSASAPADFLALLNREGAKGYFFQGTGLYIVGDMPFFSYYGYDDNFGRLPFVNDGSGQTYSYELLAQPGTMADFMTQANTEGAKGYRYEAGDNFSGTLVGTDGYMIYRKDSSSSATYAYVADPATTSAADLLAQANERGKAGYWLYPYPPGRIASENNLYVKNNASSATYVYEVYAAPALPTTLADFLAQMNSEGARGYFALSYYYTLPAMVYVKDQTQTATFTYQSVSNAIFDPANSYAAQGYAYWGYLFNIPSIPGAMTSYYVKASHCTGWMCTALDPTANVTYPIPR